MNGQQPQQPMPQSGQPAPQKKGGMMWVWIILVIIIIAVVIWLIVK